MSITRAGPIKASSDTLSIDAPSRMKCIGASMWVPLCAPNEYADNVSGAPVRMSLMKSNFIGALPAYTGVVAGSSVAVTSIHALDFGASPAATRDVSRCIGARAIALSAVTVRIADQVQALFVRMLI